MIKPPARLPIIDNSGAIWIGCISVPKLNSRIGAISGTIFTSSVKENIFKRNIKKKSRIINKSQIVKALLVTTAKQQKRRGNFFMKSSENNSVLLNQYELPYGTRLSGPVFREIRQKTKFKKVVSISKILV